MSTLGAISGLIFFQHAQAMAKARGKADVAVAPRVSPDSYTPLQKHVSFFDQNGDGKITLGETKQGLADLGMSAWTRGAAALFINGGLGFRTAADGKPTLEVSVANIKSGRHPGDTGIFDAQGKFVPANFEKMFATYDTNKDDALSWPELKVMIDANAKRDKTNTIAAQGEFRLLLQLGADGTATEGGKTVPTISKQRLMAFYDGSLFFTIAADRKARGL